MLFHDMSDGHEFVNNEKANIVVRCSNSAP